MWCDILQGLFILLQITISVICALCCLSSYKTCQTFIPCVQSQTLWGETFLCVVASCYVKKQPRDLLRMKISISLVCLVCLTLKSDGRKAQGAWGLFRVAWAAVDREARSSDHHSNTCIAHTGVLLCLELPVFVQSSSSCEKNCLAEAFMLTITGGNVYSVYIHPLLNKND